MSNLYGTEIALAQKARATEMHVCFLQKAEGSYDMLIAIWRFRSHLVRKQIQSFVVCSSSFKEILQWLKGSGPSLLLPCRRGQLFLWHPTKLGRYLDNAMIQLVSQEREWVNWENVGLWSHDIAPTLFSLQGDAINECCLIFHKAFPSAQECCERLT